MDRPLLICAGLMADRHKVLLEELRSGFDICTVHTTGTFPAHLSDIPALEMEMGTISQSEIENYAANLMRELEKAQMRLGIPFPMEEKRRALVHMMNLWAQSLFNCKSLEKLHGERRVSALLAVNDILAPIRFLVHKAKSLGIPTFFISHGASSFSAIRYPAMRRFHPNLLPPSADYVFADSELSSDLRGFEGGENVQVKYFVIGPVCDSSHARTSGPDPVPDSRLAALAFTTGWVEATTPVFALAYEYHELQTFRKFCSLARSLEPALGKVTAYLKMHPTQTSLLGTDPGKFFLETAKEQGVSLEIFQGSVEELATRADLFVNSYCSSTNEAAFIHGVPSLTCLSPHIAGHVREDWQDRLTRLAQVGVQKFVRLEDDWEATARALVEMRRSGKAGRIFEREASGLGTVSVRESARNVGHRIREISGHAAR